MYIFELMYRTFWLKLFKSSWVAPPGPESKFIMQCQMSKTLAPLRTRSFFFFFLKMRMSCSGPLITAPQTQLRHVTDCVTDGTLTNGNQIADLSGWVYVFYPLAHIWLIHPVLNKTHCRAETLSDLSFMSLSVFFFSNSSSFPCSNFQTNINDNAPSTVITTLQLFIVYHWIWWHRTLANTRISSLILKMYNWTQQSVTAWHRRTRQQSCGLH